VTFRGTAAPVEEATEGFAARLVDGVLAVEPVEHHAFVESARATVEPFLRAWEIHHALWAGKPEFHFDYHSAEIVDRDPPPLEPGGRRAQEVVLGTAVETDVALALQVIRTSYPLPPRGFAADPDVETLWLRWSGYRAGREPLPAMAYFCLTVLKMHGRLSGAVQRFGISRNVLGKLSYLASHRGDRASARKADAATTPLSDEERAWLEEAIKKIIIRAGEVAADPAGTRPALTMNDLPPLPGAQR